MSTMSDWSGFTEDEINKLKDESEQEQNLKIAKLSKIDHQQRRRNKEHRVNRSKNPKKQQDMPEAATEQSKSDQVKLIEQSNRAEANHNIQKEQAASNQPQLENVGDKNEEITDANIGVLSDEKSTELEMSSLAKLQIQQKLIEDQNKKKKILLSEALAEKFKQTQSESQKLKEIQKQLSHLDQMLQTDVEVLRNKIDGACVDFSSAQRRYEAAEKEYVTAKSDYHHKKELKEELTEHLYTIIQQNELRKAKKLEELMQKLNSGSESMPSSPISPVTMPPLPSQENNIMLNEKLPTVEERRS